MQASKLCWWFTMIICCIAGRVAAQAATSPNPNNHTEQLVAKVVWVKGKFQALAPSLAGRALSSGSPIYLHDTLITDAHSEAQIVFTDNTLMTFREGSNFYINQYAYHPDAANNKKGGSVGTYVMNLVAGGFRTITGLIAKHDPKQYQVKTPVAIIGVRGTDYSVYLNRSGQLFVGASRGAPCVTSGGGALCLGDRKAFARVDSTNAAPVSLPAPPAELQHTLPVQQLDFSAAPTVPSETHSTTSSASSGGESGGDTGGSAPPPESGGDSSSAASPGQESGGDTETGGGATSASSPEGASGDVVIPETGAESAAAAPGVTLPETQAAPPPANAVQSGSVGSFCIQ